MSKPTEIVFEVTEAAEGGYDAKALGYGIFTQGEDWTDLRAMVKDAVACHFGENHSIKVVRLHHHPASQPIESGHFGFNSGGCCSSP